jgi:hypothetical protein
LDKNHARQVRSKDWEMACNLTAIFLGWYESSPSQCQRCPSGYFSSTNASSCTFVGSLVEAESSTSTCDGASPIVTGSDNSYSVTIGDVTNDGIADVVVANAYQANQLFVGDARGGLTLNTSSPIATGSDSSYSVTIGDVTNDGIADVIVANYGKANQLFVGNPGGGLTLDTSSPIATGSGDSYSALGDWRCDKRRHR